MIKTKQIEVRVCDTCQKEQDNQSIQVHDCAICGKQVCEDCAFMITDKDGLRITLEPFINMWICRTHIKLKEKG